MRSAPLQARPQLSARDGRRRLRRVRASAWSVALPLAALLALSAPPVATGASPLLLSQAAAAEAGRWSPAWGDGGFWTSRAWVWGWYRANPAVWNWWPTSAAAWGIGGLAGAGEIKALVDGAIAARASLIAVPGTGLRLDFGSLRAVRPMGAWFLWASGDGSWRQASADCQSGLLDGAPPSDAARAELLNAACQVAYGAP